MTKHFAGLQSRATEFLLIATLFFWGWAWDFTNHGGEFLRTGRAKVFLIGAVAMAAIKFGKDWCWAIGLFYFYAALTYIQRGMPECGVVDMAMVTGALFLVPEIKRHVSLRIFENIILATAVAHSILGIFDALGMHLVFPITSPYYHGEPIGLLGQQTLLAPYLVFALAIALQRFIWSTNKVETVTYLNLCILFLTVALLTGSSMGLLSLAAVAGVFTLFYAGLGAFIGLVVLAGAGGLVANHFIPELRNDNGRFHAWRDALELIRVHPWLGYGAGSWSAFAERIAHLRYDALEAACKCQLEFSRPWTQLHNEPLQGLFEFGRVGMGLIAAALVAVGAKVREIYLSKNNALVPYVAGAALFGANGLGNFTLHVVPMGIFFAFCVFVILSFEELRCNPEEKYW